MTQPEYSQRLTALFRQEPPPLPRRAPADFVQALRRVWPELCDVAPRVPLGYVCIIAPTSAAPDRGYLVSGFRPVNELITHLIQAYGEDGAKNALGMLRSPCPPEHVQIVVCVPSSVAGMRVALP